MLVNKFFVISGLLLLSAVSTAVAAPAVPTPTPSHHGRKKSAVPAGLKKNSVQRPSVQNGSSKNSAPATALAQASPSRNSKNSVSKNIKAVSHTKPLVAVAAAPRPAQSLTLESSANSTLTSQVAAEQKPAVFSGFILAARSLSLYDFQDGTKTESMDYTLRLAARLSDSYTLKLTGIYSDDLRDQKPGIWQDSVVTLGKAPVPVGSYLLLAPSLGVGLPTSEASQQASLKAAPKVGLTTIVNPKKLIPEFSMMVNLLGTRNLHEFETGQSGNVNTAYSLTQNLNLAYEFGAGFSLTVDLIHINTWSYQNVMRDFFQASEELGYEFTKNFTLALGHTNGGSSLKADGVNSNVELFNENSSLVYVSLLAKF